MPRENIAERLSRLVEQAVRSGQYDSQTQLLQAAGISSGYLAELRQRCARNPHARITNDKAMRLSEVLGVRVGVVLGEEALPDVVDKYPERGWAVQAARSLKYPEAAIRAVLVENTGSEDPGRMYWFRRIETEAERLRPASEGIGRKR